MMKHATLALVASLAWCGIAHAQAWPNAAPSPYGGSGAPAPSATPAPSVNSGVQRGTSPHALGAAVPTTVAPGQASGSTASAPPIVDLDNPQSPRATAALNVLEAQGYADFSDFRSNGSTFTALVNDGGQKFQVVINPDTGQISRQ